MVAKMRQVKVLTNPDTDTTLMPAEQFDALLDSLNEPDNAPKLAQVASRERRFTRA